VTRADRCDVCGAPFVGDGPPWTCAPCIVDALERDAQTSGALADVADTLRAVAPFVPARWITDGARKRGNTRAAP
jgi:hypothetical protein